MQNVGDFDFSQYENNDTVKHTDELFKVFFRNHQGIKALYIGQLRKKNKKRYQGVGLIITSSGYVEMGFYIKSRLNGYGRVCLFDGKCYEGSIVNGKRCGFGKLVYASGVAYVGYYRNNQKQGESYKVKRGDLIYKKHSTIGEIEY